MSAGGRALLRVNTTNTTLDETITLGTRTIAIKFGEQEKSAFAISVSGLSLNIGGFVTIEGDVAITNGVFAGDGLTIFLGRGPAKMANGETNPLAVGAMITGARVGLIKVGETYAVYATGTISLVGLNGVTLTGTVTLLYNDTGAPVDQLIEIPGSTQPGVRVTVAAGTKSFKVTGGTLAILGQSIAGDFEFAPQANGDVTITASNVNVSIGPVSLTEAAGTLTAGAGGVAGRFNGKLAFAAGGFEFEAGIGLAIDTARPYIRFDGTGVKLKIGGQELTGDFSFERATLADGTAVTAIAARNISYSIGTPGAGASLTNGAGALLITTAGLAGTLQGTIGLSLPGDAVFTGTFALAINTGHAAVNETLTVGGESVALNLVGGPYVRIAGSGIKLALLGQELTGDFAFESISTFGADGVPGGTGTNADGKVLRLALANVNLSLGGGVLTVTNASGTLIVKGGGFAGDFGGTIALTVPNVALSGTLRIQVNTTTAAVDETIEIAGAPVALTLPIGKFFRVAGTNLKLTILGQELGGDFSVTSAGGVTTITASNVVARFGGTVLTVTQQGTATFTISPAGIKGTVSATLTLNVPNVALTGTVTLARRTRRSPPRTCGSRRERQAHRRRPGAQRLGRGRALGHRAQAHRHRRRDQPRRRRRLGGHQRRDRSGARRGHAEREPHRHGRPAARGGSFALKIDTAAPYLKVDAVGVTVRVGGQRLSADVSVEQLTTANGPAVKLALANVNLALGDGKQDLLTLTNGSGNWLILSTRRRRSRPGHGRAAERPGRDAHRHARPRDQHDQHERERDVHAQRVRDHAPDRGDAQVRGQRHRRDDRARGRLAGRRLRVHEGRGRDEARDRQRGDRDQRRRHAPGRGHDRHRLADDQDRGDRQGRRHRLLQRGAHRRHPERRLQRRVQGRLRHHDDGPDVQRREHRA